MQFARRVSLKFFGIQSKRQQTFLLTTPRCSSRVAHGHVRRPRGNEPGRIWPALLMRALVLDRKRGSRRRLLLC
jgi:hypothetical protein